MQLTSGRSPRSRLISFLAPRIERVAQPVADQVECRYGRENRQAGEKREPPREFDVLLRYGEDAAPRRRRQGHSVAEKGEGRFDEDRRGDAKARRDEDRGEGVRQQVSKDDAR